MSMIMQWDSASPMTADELRSMDTDSFIQWLEDPGERISFDVDKAWHAVHFTLVGDPWSTDGTFGQIVLGGQPFGDEIGYGPARWLTAEAVAAGADGLAALPASRFADQLDFASMLEHDIYPQIWDRDPVDEQLVEFVVAGYDAIRSHFIEAASTGNGFVICLL